MILLLFKDISIHTRLSLWLDCVLVLSVDRIHKNDLAASMEHQEKNLTSYSVVIVSTKKLLTIAQHRSAYLTKFYVVGR